MKKLALAGAAFVAATTLSACGGSADSAYCDDLKAATEEYQSLESSDLSKIDEAFDTFHSLAKEAPSDIESDWKTLDEGITTIETALSDAGLEFSDLADIQGGQLPEGVDMEKVQGLAAEFSKLSSDEFTTASQNIEKHAKDECDVDLSAAS